MNDYTEELEQRVSQLQSKLKLMQAAIPQVIEDIEAGLKTAPIMILQGLIRE